MDTHESEKESASKKGERTEKKHADKAYQLAILHRLNQACQRSPERKYHWRIWECIQEAVRIIKEEDDDSEGIEKKKVYSDEEVKTTLFQATPEWKIAQLFSICIYAHKRYCTGERREQGYDEFIRMVQGVQAQMSFMFYVGYVIGMRKE